MAVYVDDYDARYGRMIMSHMIADSTSELLDMADRIGVARKWIQKVGTYAEHFDVCRQKKTLAIRYGAISITWRELATKLRAKREKEREVSHGKRGRQR